MNEIRNNAETLAEDANKLMDSAATAAVRRYDEARNSLAAVLERGKDIYGIACKRAIKDTKAADGVLHDNLYQTVLIGIGVGALLGFLVARRGDSDSR